MSDETINNLLTALIAAFIVVIPVLAAIIVRLAKQYLATLDAKLKVEMKTDQYFLLQEMTELLIKSAEQMFTDNSDKYEYALDTLGDFARDNGIPLTDDSAQDLIEGLLKGVKQGLTPPERQVFTTFETGEMKVSRGA